jgi:hypothetical protein
MILQVSCFFKGGLGNQLFQAAQALAQSWRYNRPAVFVRWSHTPGQGNSADKYTGNMFRKLKFIGSNSHFSTVREQSFCYNQTKPVENDDTMFDGYFQSSKYWEGYEDRIREIFEPPKEVVEAFYQKYPQLSQPNTLCLHVRRSEYLKLSNIHPVVTKDYLEKGLKAIGEYSTVFIFSDDPEWVRENLNLPNSIFVSEDRDYKELWLMSLCQNYLISNSTFSWWGSYLNKNKEKKVVVPSVWFGPNGPQDYQDIYESTFHKITVKYDDGFLIPVES